MKSRSSQKKKGSRTLRVVRRFRDRGRRENLGGDMRLHITEEFRGSLKGKKKSTGGDKKNPHESSQ